MSNRSAEGMIQKAARFGPFLTAGSAAVILLHAALYIVLRQGLLGQTSFYVMFVPVVLYFSAAMWVLALFVILCLKRNRSAAWYFVCLLIYVGGLVMALVEFDDFLAVA